MAFVSLGKRIASSSTETECPAAWEARRSTGTWSRAGAATGPMKYGSPHPTVTPRPAGVDA